MAGAVLLAIAGAWLVLQVTAGQLPARLLSFRQPSPDELAAAQSIPGQIAGTATGALAGRLSGATTGTVSPVDVARVVLALGITGENAVIATAIPGRESRYNTQAHNPVYPDDSYGLWQINRLAWPQFSPAELTTLEGGARAMYVVSRGGTDWGPWKMATGSPLTGLDLATARAAVAAAQAGR